jgi:hypothetical protein
LTGQEPLTVVPAHPGAGGQLIFEARQQPDGPVLPVFSSIPFLVAALGHSQPWAVVPLAAVIEAARTAGVHRVVRDPEVSDEAWRWEPVDLGGFSWRQTG